MNLLTMFILQAEQHANSARCKMVVVICVLAAVVVAAVIIIVVVVKT